MKHLRLCLLPILFASQALMAQSIQAPTFEIRVASSSIVIDGNLNEVAWEEAGQSSPFINKWPLDTGHAVQQTKVRLLYDNDFIYVGAVNYQKKQDLIIQTLKRDQLLPFWGSDGFSIVLDPINQKSMGFLFGVNAGGAQIEGAVNLIGSWSRVNENWDNKWFSAVTVHDDYWIAEMAIPFSALRFESDATTWGLNFIRNDMKNNVFSTWSRVPLQFNGMDLGHLGTLRWPEKISPRQSRATVIPYVSGVNINDYEDGELTAKGVNAGLDMKVAVSSSMNLDLTYKPDFSNVEVDRQMTNVTRFSLLYPERRNFFLENADLFTNFGSWMVRPFFSRRIGLNNGEPVPILAGARLSGNVTRGLRIGIMDMQTQSTSELSANNYMVTALQHQVFTRSSIKIFAANRQTTQAVEGDTGDDFNRTYGGEFQYVSTDGKWNGYLRSHTSNTPERLADNGYHSAQVNFINNKLYTGVLVEKVGQNYMNDLGFIPRLYNYDPVADTTIRIGHYTINPWLGFLIYPKKSKRINLIEPNTWSVINYRSNGEFLERNTSVSVMIMFKDMRQFYAEAFNTSVQLPFAADLIGAETPIPAGRYDFTQYTLKYTTNTRKALSGDVSTGYGRFYNGNRMEYGGSINYRVQPWGMFSIAYLQNDIQLPGEYGTASFQLIGPRAEVSLRNNIWWTTFLQYNTQEDNFNVNSRFQWRYRPMSDFFIVYTDNYFANGMNVKNRGLVFKLTYWLNL